MEQTTPPTKHTYIMLLILAFVLLAASIIGYILSQRMNADQRGGGDKTQRAILPTTLTSVAPTLIPYPTKGSFVLTEQTGLKTVKQGIPFTLNLIATSPTDVIAGYDAILSYDTTAFERQSIQNKLDSFRIFTYDRGDHLSLSATKNLQVTTPIQFTNTLLLSITLTAQKKGTYTFSLKPVGNESSKLVNESAQVSYPQTSDFLLEIE